MRELRERGIATIDLKAAFVASPDRDLLYRHADSHWRWNAALLAFNMTMNAIGHDEWSLDPATSLTPLSPVPAGDLARLLGLQDRLPDADYALRIGSAGGRLDADRRVSRTPRLCVGPSLRLGANFQGERLLVLGDSFT